MTLHPDILTDLVILYHAGEASQASRALLEAEAARNPQLAAALSARPGTGAQALPGNPAPDERKVFRKVRTRYQVIAVAAVWTFVLLMLALLPQRTTSTPLIIALLPFLLLITLFAAAVGVLYFFFRGLR